MRSGFATLSGRPNVGKSTLLNCLLGHKVSIVSDKPNTTRSPVRGVLHGVGHQVVFVDTPGVHRPRTLLGRRLNESAEGSLEGVDVIVVVVDATAPVGPGDRLVASRAGKDAIVVVNKVDLAPDRQVLERLSEVQHLEASEYFPVSAKTGEGVEELVRAVVSRMPEGPPYYPPGVETDVAEAAFVAELVREKLLGLVSDELPHSIATRVSEWEWPRVRVEILVERESQKGIVIGRGGTVLREVGTAVRSELDPQMYLELFVKVDRNWQRRAGALDRLGI